MLKEVQHEQYAGHPAGPGGPYPPGNTRYAEKGRLSAGEIGEAFPVTGAAVSRHLAVLREAGLVRDQREGKFIYYELNTSVLEEVMLWLAELREEGAEYVEAK